MENILTNLIESLTAATEELSKQLELLKNVELSGDELLEELERTDEIASTAAAIISIDVLDLKAALAKDRDDLCGDKLNEESKRTDANYPAQTMGLLFKQLDRLNNDESCGDELDKEVKRAEAVCEIVAHNILGNVLKAKATPAYQE